MTKWKSNTLICVDDEIAVLETYEQIFNASQEEEEIADILGMAGQVNGSDQRAKFRLLLASSGSKAVQLLKSEMAAGRRVVAGFFDMRMPGMDGYETIKALRGLDNDIICAVVTAYTDRRVKQIRTLFPAEQQDEFLYLKKPFDPEALEQTAYNMVSAWNRKRQLEKHVHSIEQTAHMAGMAEVATGILHNIGNINTSINVRLELIRDGLQKMEALSLASIADILEENLGNLDSFFNDDPKGSKVIQYLKLANNASDQHLKNMLSEVNFLFEQLCHVNEIILLQQRYARGDAKVWEKCKIHELIKDAVRMLGNVLNKNLIQLYTDLTVTESVTVNRPQLVQVLVNLIKNACESIALVEPDEKRIIISDAIRTDMSGPMLMISVEDTGAGFESDRAEKIFSYGYSTKDHGGKGYGLHYCANYIQSIGGRIEADSPGPGQGAVFTVWMPMEGVSGEDL